MRPRQESSDARRLLAVAAVVLSALAAGCDPIRMISASRGVEHPLDQSCAVRVLRSSELVKAAGVSDQGMVFADLVIPERLDRPDPAPQILVRETPTSPGSEKTEVTFYVSWVGGKGSHEYREYVEQAVEKLHAAAIEACTETAHAAAPEQR